MEIMTFEAADGSKRYIVAQHDARACTFTAHASYSARSLYGLAMSGAPTYSRRSSALRALKRGSL